MLGSSLPSRATVFQAQIIAPDVRQIAAAFIALHEAREQADYDDGATITLAPKKLILTRRASEGSASEPSLARRVSMCKDAKLSCRGNIQHTEALAAVQQAETAFQAWLTAQADSSSVAFLQELLCRSIIKRLDL